MLYFLFPWRPVWFSFRVRNEGEFSPQPVSPVEKGLEAWGTSQTNVTPLGILRSAPCRTQVWSRALLLHSSISSLHIVPDRLSCVKHHPSFWNYRDEHGLYGPTFMPSATAIIEMWFGLWWGSQECHVRTKLVPEADQYWGTDRENLSGEGRFESRLEGSFDDRAKGKMCETRTWCL